MAQGVLIAESLRADAVFDGLDLSVDRIWCSDSGVEAAGQPLRWTLLRFSVPDDGAQDLAERFAAALDVGSWYVDLSTAEETFVVYAGKVFRYRQGDAAGRAEAAAHGRSVGVPEEQLDWPG